MKKPTLSLLTIAVIFAPLTALAQKIQRKHNTSNQTNSIPVERLEPQINHNAYGTPLTPPTQELTAGDRFEIPKAN